MQPRPWAETVSCPSVRFSMAPPLPGAPPIQSVLQGAVDTRNGTCGRLGRPHLAKPHLRSSMRTQARPLAALSLTVATAVAVSACGGGAEATDAASPGAGEITVTHAPGETAVPARSEERRGGEEC